MLLWGKRGKEFIPCWCFGASECKWMESVHQFAKKLYVQWKDCMPEFICSFFDLAELPTETKFNQN